jgi:hypothetical protein
MGIRSTLQEALVPRIEITCERHTKPHPPPLSLRRAHSHSSDSLQDFKSDESIDSPSLAYSSQNTMI